MNHDENKSGIQAGDDAELEARVIAAVLEEPSAAEAAELERILIEKPELAVFKRRIQAVHGLVGEAVRPESLPLRMSPERRAKLLQTLGADAKTPPTKVTAPSVLPTKRRREWRRFIGIAAGLMVGVFATRAIRYSADQKEKAAPLARYEREQNKPEDSENGPSSPPLPALIVGGSGETDARLKNGFDERAESGTSAPMSGLSSRSAPENTLFDRKLSKGVSRRPLLGRDNPLSSDDAQARPLLGPQKQVVFSAKADSGPRGVHSLKTDELSSSTGYASEKPVEMPKFEVKEDAPGRYHAAANLAGTRMTSPTSPVPVPELQISLAASAPERPRTNEEVRDVNDLGPRLDGADSKNVEIALHQTQKTKAGTAGANSPDFFDRLQLEERKSVEPGLVPQMEPQKIELAPFTLSADKDLGYQAQAPITAKKMAEIADASAASATLAPPLADAPVPRQKPAPAARAEDLTLEVATAKQPVSTFSLHVSDVSFRLAAAALDRGEKPDPAVIRPEEFYNAFNYADPAPAMSDKVACHIEQSAHPFLQQRNLVRIAVKVPATGRGAGQPLRLTVLLDTSGSMEREDRAASVRSALGVLVSLLGPNDRLTLVGFARQPRLMAEELPGDRAREALDLLAQTPAEGGTNLEEALRLAGELAQRHQASNAQNRIVLLTDGAANLGNADPAQLSASIEALRQQGIAFDACGVGTTGIDDGMLEALTRKGDGRYYVLNSPEAADAGFARQLAGAFRPAAENVKLQVRFNPARVGAYRLIGFEQHRLKEEDFRNDKVDAAELAADEAATAVYQVETLPQGEGEVGEVYVRFRDAVTGNMVERSWTLRYDPQVAAFERAPSNVQLAGVAALVAEKLRGGGLADAIKLDDLTPAVNSLRGRYAQEARVQELVRMFEQLRRMDSR